MSRAIIARDDEVRVIESMLDDEVEQPRAVLIQGEPGIGKTTLFDGLLEMAGERGFRSLTCRPTQSEMDLSYVASLRAGSLVLAILQNDVGVSVDSAGPDVVGSKITINLNKLVPSGKTAKVAWFVVN